MSRTLSTAMGNAIEKVSGIRTATRITLFKNRNYFASLDSTSGSPSYAQNPVVTDSPLSQCVFHDSSNDRIYNLFVNPDNEKIEITTTGSPQVCQIYSSGSPVQSPKWSKITARTPYLYHEDTAGRLRVETMNMTTLRDTFTSGSLNCVTSGSTIETLTSGSISALCVIDDLEFVRMYIDEGGVRPVHYKFTGGSWVKNFYGFRFMIPDDVLESDQASGYLLNFFTAVKRSDGIWIYWSYPSGEVKGIHINNDGIWSDIFVAIPKDLSVFKIANAFVDANERIHLCGQWQRVDPLGDFSSTSIWNLLSSSDDGKIFTLDRNILFSMMGYRFHALPINDEIYYVDSGRYSVMTGTYNSSYENTDSLVLRKELGDVNGSPDSGYKVDLTTTNDALLDHALLVEGNIAKLEIGVNTSGSDLEFTTYDTCIVSTVTTTLANARRSLSLDLVSEGLYRLQQFSYPFYLEMQGKQSKFDPIDDMSNLYKAPLSSGIKEAFSVDFWGNEDRFGGGGLCAQFHNTSGSDQFMSTDLKDYLYLTEYPIVDVLPLTFKIFGWGRIGMQTGSDYFDDTTPASNPNDDWVAVIKVKHEDDSEDTITMTKEQAQGGVSWFPQTWKEGNARLTSGSYPIQYIIDADDGLTLGDKVMEVGVNISSSSATVYYPERIEIPELDMYIDPDAMPQDSHEIAEITEYDPNTATTSWNFDDGTTQGWVSGAPPWGQVCRTGAVGASVTDNFYAHNGGIGFTSGANWVYGNASFDVSSQALEVAAGVTFTGSYYGIHSHAGFKINAAIEFTDGTVRWAFGDEYSGDTGWLSIGDTGTFTVTPLVADYGKIIKRVWVGTFGYQYDNAQSKVFDNLAINGVEATQEELFSDNAGKKGIVIKNLGIPNVYFSSKPYTAFNFEASVKVKVVGSYSYGGIVGIAEDGRNFVCGRYKSGLLEIVKVRNGETTVLASEVYTSTNTFVRIMFSHKNGQFYLRVQENGVWGSPKVSYFWKYEDGPIATDNDLFHVGIFSIADVPKFRITSFNIGQNNWIPLLPGYDKSKFSAFPYNGQVVIDNMIYNFGGKSGDGTPKGPFQVRCANSWDYNSPYDGEHFSGNSIEITNFYWGNPSGDGGMLVASNANYCWQIQNTDWTVWITTGGQLIYLKDRSRIFGLGLDPNIGISCEDKAFVTVGLGLVTLAPNQEIYTHQEGAYCYLNEDSEVEFIDFYASSDDQDSTIKDLIERICKMSGTKSLFPGDNTHSTLSLSDGIAEEV